MLLDTLGPLTGAPPGLDYFEYSSVISTWGVCTYVGNQAEISKNLRDESTANAATLANLESTTPRGDTAGTTLTLWESEFGLDRAGGQFPSRASLSPPSRPRRTTGTYHEDLCLH